MLIERSQFAAKVEAVEGGAEALAAVDALHALEPKFNPDSKMHKRKPMTSSLSPHSAVPGARSATIEFDCELKGSGVVGTPPAFGKLLRACGFLETINIGVSVVYTPASTGIPCLSMAIYRDGVARKIWGARGDAKIILPPDGQPGRIHFVFTGADFSVTDVAFLVGISYEASTPPPFLAAQLAVHSYAALCKSVEIPLNNRVALRPDVNTSSGYKSAVITGRNPMMTFDPEHVLVATHDFYGKLRAGTLATLTTAVGTVAGNICTITAPKVQYTKISENDNEGIETLGIDCDLNRNAGDDELQLAFT